MADNLLFLTELLGLPVHDIKGRRIGRVKDAALVPLIDPVRIDRYLVGGGWSWLTVRRDQVRSISLDGIFLQDEQLTPYHSDEYMLRLVRDLLDQQIIDAQGRKVVRVTDVTFVIRRENSHEVLSVLEVDIGLRSIFRRLMQGVLPPRWIRRLQGPIPPNSIRWEHCSIVEHDPQRRLRLNLTTDALERMHPADLADIVEELSPEDQEALITAMDSETAAETLSEIEPEIQARILESIDTEKAADIIEEMSPDEAAHVLNDLEEETTQEILDEMEMEPKSEVSELLEYDERTAGGMMNTEFVALSENATIADAMEALRGNEDLLENLNTIFLVGEDQKLVAAVPLGKLFLGRSEVPLKTLAADSVISTTADEKQDRVTELFDKYNLLTLPVVDEEQKLVGVITADDIITALRQ